MDKPGRSFLQKVDIPAILGQFLINLRLEDLVIELIQNELDAFSPSTVISFEEDRLTCEGLGRPVDKNGWTRLEVVAAAGGDIEAKKDGIGMKNHGLRTGFLIGDNIIVQSTGHRVDLTVRPRAQSNKFSPGTWSRVVDSDAPLIGTRITVPYRTQGLVVPSGEIKLEPLSLTQIKQLYESACSEIPTRLLGVLPAGSQSKYSVTLLCENRPEFTVEFQCSPIKRKGNQQLSRRRCFRVHGKAIRELLQEEMVSAFPLYLPKGDSGRIPRFFRRNRRLFGEIAWVVGGSGRLLPSEGILRYPISFPQGQYAAFSDHGFHISGPFIPDIARHGITDGADRNASIINQSRIAFAKLLKNYLLPNYGPRALLLLRRAASPSATAEKKLLAEVVRIGALPVTGKASKHRYTVVNSSRDYWSVTIATFTWKRDVLDKKLMRLAPQDQAFLHYEVPGFVVAGLLNLSSDQEFNARIVSFSEKDVIALLAPADESQYSSRQETNLTATQFEQMLGALRIVQYCADQKKLDATFEKVLLSRGLLSTTKHRERPWQGVYYCHSLIPSIDGVQDPRALDLRLTKLDIFRKGNLKLNKFRLDEYLKRLNFEPAGAENRTLFFEWLGKNYSRLKASTLGKLAEFPFWPTSAGSHTDFRSFCVPKNPRLREILAEVIPQPAKAVLSFPGIKRSNRGALHVRTIPSESELRLWYQNRWRIIDEVVVNGDSGKVQKCLDELERDIALLIKDKRLSRISAQIASGHQTLSRSNDITPVKELHSLTAPVKACRLLPNDMIAGRYQSVYRSLGARQRPSPEAIRRVLGQNPTDGDLLYRRLEAFKLGDGILRELSSDPIILLDGTAVEPESLTLPGQIDLWGDWKCQWKPKYLTPERQDLLLKIGVVRQVLSEQLSQDFFIWISSQSLDVQRQHLPQVMRHLRDRQRGPLKWWSHFPQLPCLPVRGKDDYFALACFSRVTSQKGYYFLPDFPELQDELLKRDSSRKLVITDLEGIQGSLFAPLRQAGIKSLRVNVGRPTRLYTSGEAQPILPELQQILIKLQSEQIITELPKRLELHGVPSDHLRPNWRLSVKKLKGIRVAPDLRGVFSIGGRNYDIPLPSGVDDSGLVWLVPSRNIVMGLFEALAAHVLREEAGPLSPYGLLKAIELPFSSIRYSRAKQQTEAEVPDGSQGEHLDSELHKSHGINETDLQPSAPEPSPFDLTPIRPSPPVERKYVKKRPRPTSSTALLRGAVQEQEQIRQLKEDHYSWHCQACLGKYDVSVAIPPYTYLVLDRYRRANVQAAHIDQLRSKGIQGAWNLLVLCNYHHYLLGDRLTRQLVLTGLNFAKAAQRKFPLDHECSTFLLQ